MGRDDDIHLRAQPADVLLHLGVQPRAYRARRLRRRDEAVPCGEFVAGDTAFMERRQFGRRAGSLAGRDAQQPLFPGSAVRQRHREAGNIQVHFSPDRGRERGCRDVGRDIAVGAGTVVDHEVMPEPRTQLDAHQTRGEVGTPARREAHEHPHRALRIGGGEHRTERDRAACTNAPPDPLTRHTGHAIARGPSIAESPLLLRLREPQGNRLSGFPGPRLRGIRKGLSGPRCPRNLRSPLVPAFLRAGIDRRAGPRGGAPARPSGSRSTGGRCRRHFAVRCHSC